MKPRFDEWVLSLACLAAACGGRTSLGDSGEANEAGNSSFGTSSGGAPAATSLSASSSTTGGKGGSVGSSEGARATGGAPAGLGGTSATRITVAGASGSTAAGGASNAKGGAGANGGTGTGGVRASGGVAFAGGGTQPVGSSLGQGGMSPFSGGAGVQAGGSGSGGTTAASGGVTLTGGTTSTAASSDAGSCDNGWVLCGTGAAASCVNTQTDPKHCGQCGNVCAKGAECASGSCALPRCAPTFRLGSNPTIEIDPAAAALVVGDLNGDGYPDIVTANGRSHTVSALLGDGTGVFRERTDHAVGSNPMAVAIGDFNHDGHLDVVAANYDTDSVSVLLGSGEGAFEPDVQYLVGDGPRAIAIADFDRDGFDDLATVNGDANTVSILLGVPDGTFAHEVEYPAAEYATQLHTGDFNEDGNVDLLTNGGPSTAYVLLGNGNGGFAADSAVPAVGGASHLALGDLNSDGKQDLIAARRGGRYSSGMFGVFFGAGDGSFLPLVEYEPKAAGPIASADLDRDGKAELVAYTRNQSVSVLTLDASGGLAAEAVYPTPAPPQRVVIADLNRDDWLDIVTLDAWGIYPLLATGQGEFDSPQRQPTVGRLHDLLLHDFDGDGNLDLAGLAFHDNTDTASLNVHRGSGNGSFAVGTEYPARRSDEWIEVGDLDDDGYPDLVTASKSESGVSVLWNVGGASYPKQTVHATDSVTSFMALGDVDESGTTDILVASGDPYSETSSITVLLNSGNGDFVPLTISDAARVARMGLVDLNHDGRLDLVETDGEQDGLMVRLGLGDGTFGSPLQSATHGGGIYHYGSVFGDLDGDGNLDVVARSTSGSFLDVMLGVGDGTFVALAPQAIAPDYTPGRLALGDMNGDGTLDLVSNALVYWVGQQMVVMLGAGDGTFACATASLASGVENDSFAVGDLDGDGRPDLVVPVYDSESFTVLLNQSL